MRMMTKFAAATLSVAALTLSTTALAEVATGSQIPDMTVTDSNGKTHNLSDFEGKRVVLEWTNKGCPYVQKHYGSDNMQKLQKSATADGETVWLTVISSAPGKQGYEDGESANELMAEWDAAPTAVILDPEGDMGKAFNAKTTPHMYVITPDQTLVYQGAIDDNRSSNPATIEGAENYVASALADLDAGRPVATAETAPYGCSVKYKS